MMDNCRQKCEVKIAQINCHKSEAVMAEVRTLAYQQGIHVLLVQEPWSRGVDKAMGLMARGPV